MDLSIEVLTMGGSYSDATLLTTISDVDIVREQFEHHQSVCENNVFTFGGCVAAWCRFTTTKMTYDNGGVETPIPWSNVRLYVELTEGSSITKRLGVFYPKEHEEMSNHTQVTVTAYDAMYKIRNADFTTWYENYAATYTTGRTLKQFYDDFANELKSRYLIDSFGYALPMFDNLPKWLPEVPAVGGNTRPLLNGTITGGKLLHDISEVALANAFIEPSSHGTVLLSFYTLGTGFQYSIAPTEYTTFEYNSEDNGTYTNVRIQAYDFPPFEAGSTPSDKMLGISDNMFTNSMAFIDDGDPTPVNTRYATRLLGFIGQADIFRPGVVKCFMEAYHNLSYGLRLNVTGTDGNVYSIAPMQRDIVGLKAMMITYTSLYTEDLFNTDDFVYANEYGEYVSDMTGKVDVQGGTGATNVSWEIRPSTTKFTHGGTDVIKVNGSGLSLDAVSIKKNGIELATVATTGSYNDLTNKPTIPTTDNYLARGSWWTTGSGQNIDNIKSGIHFVYPDHGAPVAGTLIAFAGYGANSENYEWQMIKSYNNNLLYIRGRNGDNGTWSAWYRMARADELPTKLSDLTDDVVNGKYVKLTDSAAQTIKNTSNSRTALVIQAGASDPLLMYRDANGEVAQIGVNSTTKRPIIRYSSADHDIALTADIPTNTNQLTNGAGFITESSTSLIIVPPNVSTSSSDLATAYTNFLKYVCQNYPGMNFRTFKGVIDSNGFHNVMVMIYNTNAHSNYVPQYSWGWTQVTDRLRTWVTYEYVLRQNITALTSDIPTVGTAAAKDVGDFMQRLPLWAYNTTHDVDDAEVGVRFVYTTHGAPVNGTLLTVGGSTNDAYRWQVILQYNGTSNNVYFRKRNGDNGTWSSWQQIVMNGSFLPTTGGTMTGNIKWQDNTALPQQTAGTMPYFLGLDSFANGGATKWQDAANVSTALSTYLVKKTTAIQSGTVSITAVGTATALNFGTAFAGVPKLTLTPVGSSLATVSAYASSVTASGATVFCNKVCTLHWIAYYG